MKNLLLSITFTLFLPLFLFGCVSINGIKQSNNSLEREANFSLKQEDYTRASVLFLTLADRTIKSTSNNFRLDAINAAILGKNFNFAQKQLSLLSQESLKENQKQKIQLFQAELSLIQGRGELAQKLLEKNSNKDLPLKLRNRYFMSLSEAYLLNGKILNHLLILQKLEKEQLSEKFRSKVQIKLIDSLMTQLANSSLNDNPRTIELDKSWLELALLLKDYDISTKDLSKKIQDWRVSNPKKKVKQELFTYFKNLPKNNVKNYSRIAVLLPQTGKFSQAAAAIRDGILANYYSQKETNRPTIRFYDSTDSSKIWSIYDKAKNDGAEIIIGPLQKDAVSQLLRIEKLSIPILALNAVKMDSLASKDFFMFTLSPESEAKQAADKIWLDGRRYPAILVPETEWGERITEAFYSRWRELGDLPANVSKYNPKSKDFSSAITRLFHIDDSKSRYKEIKKLIGKNIEFEPRRRGDIDAIFLAARPRQAQSFNPLLQFHRAGDLPLYATSHAWTGELNEQQLADMKGMMLADLPIFSDQKKYKKFKESIPNLPNSLIRLYAMGDDAFSLITDLQRLKENNSIHLKGKTGKLYMGPDNQIQRQTTWLKLAKNPKVIGYAARLNSLPEELELSNIETRD